MTFDRHELPSPYYRVAVRGIVYDDKNRVLVLENTDHVYELPGGGWEYEESFGDTMRREFREELSGAKLTEVGELWFTYRGYGSQKVWMLRMVAKVKLASYDVTPSDNMITAKFVNREEFLALNWCGEDRPILEHIDKLWPQ